VEETMILSVSRRTDIPAFYSEWFFNRIKEGFAHVPNPMNERQIARIAIDPVKIERQKDFFGTMETSGNVDGIVFWTKDATPMLNRINELENFVYYFQYTLNPYNKSIEKNVPEIEERIKTFIELAKKIGKNRIIWRYDPIFLDRERNISVEWHIEKFTNLIAKIASFTEKCIFSFIDITPRIRNTFNTLTIIEMKQIAKAFSEIAKKYKIKLETCAEEIDFSKFDISHGHCIDADLFERLWLEKGFAITRKNEKFDAQRKHCGCMPCVDIGIFDTCNHKCDYCYATRRTQNKKHISTSESLLHGFDGTVYDRKAELVFEYTSLN
jgi:DNA repair photolyase